MYGHRNIGTMVFWCTSVLVRSTPFVHIKHGSKDLMCFFFVFFACPPFSNYKIVQMNRVNNARKLLTAIHIYTFYIFFVFRLRYFYNKRYKTVQLYSFFVLFCIDQNIRLLRPP